MLEVQFAKSVTLKKIVDAISGLATEVNFDGTSSGLTVQAMDSAHVSLIVMLLKADSFADYRVDRNVTLGLNLGSLQKILKVAGNDDTVTIKANDNDSDTVTFVFENENRNKCSTFQLKLTSIDQDKLGIPDTEYKAVVTMPAGEFQRIVASMGSLGDTVSIGVAKEGVSFSVTGDIGSGSTLIKRNGSSDDEAVTIVNEEEVTLTFAVRYLSLFTKATSLATQVKLSMSPEVPLLVNYPIIVEGEEKKKEGGYIRFFLAPKIEDDN